MIDRYVYVINGWKVDDSEKCQELEDELYEIDDDFMDTLDSFYITDSMCGEYAYFGAILGWFDADEEPQNIVINEKLLFDADEKYKKFLKDNPKYAKIFEKYSNREPAQVMVVLHVS